MGIMRQLFGGSKSKSKSGNHAYEGLDSALSPTLGYVSGAGNALSSMLGIGGDSEAQKGALDNFAHSGGMDWLMDRGNRGVVANRAAQGLLKSGSTLKGMESFSQGLASTYLTKYLDQIFNLGKLGLGSADVLAQAGQYGSSTQKSSGGVVPALLGSGGVGGIPGI